MPTKSKRDRRSMRGGEVMDFNRLAQPVLVVTVDEELCSILEWSHQAPFETCRRCHRTTVAHRPARRPRSESFEVT